MIEIDFAEPTDALELKALFLDAFTPVAARLGYRPGPMDRGFGEAFGRRMVLRARIEDGRPIRAAGFAVVAPYPRHLYVDAIAVEPPRQGRGVGGALLTAVERLASELCLGRVELNTDPRLDDVLAFYRREGYDVVSAGAHGGAPTVRLRKRVDTRLDQILGRAPKDARA